MSSIFGYMKKIYFLLFFPFSCEIIKKKENMSLVKIEKEFFGKTSDY